MKRRQTRIMNLSMFIMVGILPFLLHCTRDWFIGTVIEYTKYYPEIYMFILVAFTYNLCSFFRNGHIVFNTTKLIILQMGILIFLISTMIYVYSFYAKSDLTSFIYMVIFALVSLTLVVIIAIIEKDENYYESKYEKYSENGYEKYLLERMDKKLNLIKNLQMENAKEKHDDTSPEELLNGSDVLAEMLKNHIEIKEYFSISKSQSKLSFFLSIVSAVVGIIMVIIAVVGIVIFNNPGTSIIAGVSGAITEIISGVVLWIHNKSALQLNYYYDSLHENEKFLSAVNIADKLSEEKKEDMYIEIIRKQIQIKNKEKNLSDMDSK